MNSVAIYGQTDVGQRRQDNQDTFICQPLDSPKWPSQDLALLAVIDGVGGYAGGDQAAAIARTYLEAYMAEPKGDILSMLREAVVHANNQILEARRQDLRFAQMSCVLTAAVADAGRNRLYVVHVGDTRLYRFRNGGFDKLTSDHSLVGVREDAGELSEAEAMNHPRRNEILRDVGSAHHQIDDPDFFDAFDTDFQPGDVLLLCSDGLSDMLTKAQMTAVLNQKASLQAQVQQLIDLANQQGGKDNITVVLAQHTGQAVATPRPADRKQTGTYPKPAPAIPAPVRPAEPAAVYADEPLRQSQKPKRTSGLWIGLALLAVLGIAAYVWMTTRPDRPTSPAELSIPEQAMAAAQPTFLDTLLTSARQHRLVMSTDSLPDTLRLSRPIAVADTLDLVVTGNPLVILPADSTSRFPAFSVAANGLLKLNGIRISEFQTAIQAGENAKITLNNVTFHHVQTRVAALAAATDSTMNEEIQLSVKPITPKKNIRK
nr:protein phosphatase 2C domain-containing protein [uncultured Arsenicibacter sp.]